MFINARRPQLFNLPLTLMVREEPRFTFEIIDNKEHLTIKSKQTTAEENPQNGQGRSEDFGSHFYWAFLSARI